MIAAGNRGSAGVAGSGDGAFANRSSALDGANVPDVPMKPPSAPRLPTTRWQGMTGRQITWIARQAMPSFLLMCAAVLLIWFFPGLVTWLPQQMKMG